jgi:hypothetical protein
MDYGNAPEDDSPARSWLDSHDKLFGTFINNKWNKDNEVRRELSSALTFIIHIHIHNSNPFSSFRLALPLG